MNFYRQDPVYESTVSRLTCVWCLVYVWAGLAFIGVIFCILPLGAFAFYFLQIEEGGFLLRARVATERRGTKNYVGVCAPQNGRRKCYLFQHHQPLLRYLLARK